MADPYEVDDEGNPVAEPDSVAEGDLPADDPLRRQIEATLRFVRLSTAVGVVVIAVLAILLSDVRGVLILVGFVYLVTSLAAYWYLRRNLMARLRHQAVAPSEPSG
ncbi:MAG TPA: hypothetical protein VMH33_06150 [Solirubrobacterales bacterium]|nr:hypothetical protein [Solirubrobacterales bacterium]